MSNIENIEHERAKVAYDCIKNVAKENIDKKEYRSIVLKTPTLIITNGLGQTLAFLKAKCGGNNNVPEGRLYKDIEEWLKKCQIIKGNGELIEEIINLPNERFRYATSETLSFLAWMKRFAEALLPKED